MKSPRRPGPPAEPRQGKALIAALRRFTEEDRARSWWYFLSTAALLALALGATLAASSVWVGLLASVLAGLLMVRLFVIYHDHQHHAILRNSRLAEWLMTAVGIYTLAPPGVWQSSHNYHHNHNSKLRSAHIGSYPIMTTERYARTSRNGRFQYLFQRHPLTILFGYVFVFLFGMCLYPFLKDPRRHLDSLVALLVHAGAAVLLAGFFGWPALVLTLVLPQFIASALGSYLFYAQHNFPGVLHKDAVGWTYEGAALESSSFLRTNAVMHWFTANIGYHHIHHLDARIPFYRLPEAMRCLPELQSPRTTSLDPREIARCLRLKVWDVEAQRMVGLPA